MMLTGRLDEWIDGWIGRQTDRQEDND